jgi:hypothetical protein
MFDPITTTLDLPQFPNIMPAIEVHPTWSVAGPAQASRLMYAIDHNGDLVWWDSGVYDRIFIRTYAEAYYETAKNIHNSIRTFMTKSSNGGYQAVIDGVTYKYFYSEGEDDKKRLLYARKPEFSQAEFEVFTPSQAEIRSIMSALVRQYMAGEYEPRRAKEGFTPSTVTLMLESSSIGGKSSDPKSSRTHYIRGKELPRT